MFTGIVEEIGAVTAVEPSGDGVRLTVRAPQAVSDAAHGDSISVSGVCLTVVGQDAASFTADVMRQTLDMSTLAGVAPGRAVNIERADKLVQLVARQHGMSHPALDQIVALVDRRLDANRRAKQTAA